ncbi:hypothetical protein PY650_36045 [Rhizobium calliandrae]|uniref:Uncharacterized protein n=1 Tax=Rhizobium calliandrae TaxID=1312182 RepID=A0ABT7KQD8_9HYPH|nr:hypothetical protein [Rhizobium calliandrae]MDL2410851.1 hypothetical protein [Rhizobium calliandrae]
MSFYAEGFDAYQSGFDAKDCPYHLLTAGYDLWVEGWFAAFNFCLEAE